MVANRGLRFSTAASRLVEEVRHRQPQDRLFKRLSALEYVKGSVSSTIDEYLREGKFLKKDELDRCVQELRRYKKYPQALEIIDWMLFRKFNLKSRDYAARLDLVAKVQGISAAEKYLTDLPSTVRSSSAYGSLLNCYCFEQMKDKAEELFTKMLEEKMIFNAQPYNTLMSLYLKLEMPEKVVALTKEMEDRDIKPDTFTYNMLMRSYSILKDVDGVERALEEMENPKNGVPCNWTTYSSLAIAYINCGHHEKAKPALKKLEDKMDESNRDAHHFLISLYGLLSDPRNIVRIWDALKLKFSTLTNKCYLVTLQALKNAGDIEELKKVYEDWKSAHSLFDVRIVNTVVSVHLKHDMLQDAESIIRWALDKSPLSFFVAWDMLMNYFLEKGDVERALRMMEAASLINREDWNIEEPDKLEQFVTNFDKEHDIGSIRELYKSLKEITYSARGPLNKVLLQAYLSGCEAPELPTEGASD